MPELASEAPVATDCTGQFYRVRDHYAVGREKVREFARAVRNNHPAHRYEADAAALGYDAIIAPPTFASVVGMSTTRALLDSVLSQYDMSQILQTDQVFHMHRPILAGDQLSTQTEIESIRRVRGNDFVSVNATITDAQGKVVQVAVTTIVARLGGDISPDIAELVANVVMHEAHLTLRGPAIAPLAADHAVAAPDFAQSRAKLTVQSLPRFADLTVGTELPPASIALTRGDLVNYAGVTGDPNPIHFSDHAAGLAGLPTVVAHGLLTMGLGADYLTSWLGDPTAIETYSVRFAGLVPVTAQAPTEVVFSGRIKSMDPDRRTATVLLGGRSEGKKLFGRAVAQVQLS